MIWSVSTLLKESHSGKWQPGENLQTIIGGVSIIRTAFLFLWNLEEATLTVADFKKKLLASYIDKTFVTLLE